jgi:hypothetical protein
MARVVRPLVACIAAGAAVAVLLPAAASGESLRLVDRAALELAGRGFTAGERVRVRVEAAGERTVRRVRAGRSGRFRAVFPGLTFDPCTGMTAVATGGDGSRAILKRAPRQCPPPLQPGADQHGEPAPAPDGACGPPDTDADTDAAAQRAGKRAQPACPPS